jgi:hypothetical protein
LEGAADASSPQSYSFTRLYLSFAALVIVVVLGVLRRRLVVMCPVPFASKPPN